MCPRLGRRGGCGGGGGLSPVRRWGNEDRDCGRSKMRIGGSSGILAKITDTARAAMGNAGGTVLIVGIRTSLEETLLPIEGGIGTGEKRSGIVGADGHGAVVIVTEDVGAVVRRGAGGTGAAVSDVL